MICPKCNGEIPDISRYCLHCGGFLSPPDKQEEETDIDWENRVLCSDGACIGTIRDGKCTVCGKTLSGAKTR